MLKRFGGKSRRYSADDVDHRLSSTAMTTVVGIPEERGSMLDRSSPSGRCSLEGQIQAFNAALMLRVSRNKYARRSCGDAASLQGTSGGFSTPGVVDDPRQRPDMDYQTVTAVPAFIVEHEPEKQQQQQQPPQRGFWGRRMSKKIESFRRSGSRESTCSSPPDVAGDNNNEAISDNNRLSRSTNDRANNDVYRTVFNVNSSPVVRQKKKREKDGNSVDESFEGKKCETKLATHRSPSPFKSFFIRMGSTGMLNSTRSSSGTCKPARNSSQQRDNCRQLPDKEGLFRSCSTSHLNASPTYVKGDDPTDGIDLRMGNNRRDRTLSCDDLAVHEDSTSEEMVFASTPRSLRNSAVPVQRPDPADITKDANKKCHFPHAFLRSRLSVLPEERQQQHQQQQQQHQSSTRDERLFKATSEEHFPTVLRMTEFYDGATTLGRRGTRMHANAPVVNSRYWRRNSYAEMSSGRDEERLFSDGPPAEDELLEDDVSPRARASPATGKTSILGERRFSETRFPIGERDIAATLSEDRRNSAPSCDQRLSSHYVSSNESGYDSDGPRVDVTSNALENADALAIDSETKKPRRRVGPRDSTVRQGHDDVVDIDIDIDLATDDFTIGGNVVSVVERPNGLGWHRQSNSGRILPSINRRDCDDLATDMVARRLGGFKVTGEIAESRPPVENGELSPSDALPPHRARLQRDKTRFLSDIVKSACGRIKRRRVVQLDKEDHGESLGIRLAQQCDGDRRRYIVVQLECGGIAHRDGRLRLGDEIVQVEGKELRSLNGLEEVQRYLRSFTSNARISLVTAYEESLPEMLDETENTSTTDFGDISSSSSSSSSSTSSSSFSSSSSSIDVRKSSSSLAKNPQNDAKSREGTIRQEQQQQQQQQQCMTRHSAKFHKGCGKPSLGFSVVGGMDSPRGDMGIFVRRVFPGGQADVSRSLFQGDEILSLNGQTLRGYTHREVIELFKAVREGPVELDLARRHRYGKTPVQSRLY